MHPDERDNVIKLKKANQFTDTERQELFLVALGECDGNVTKACEMADVSRKEYNFWCAESQEFIANIDEVAEGILDGMEQILIDAAKNDNLTAVIFYLKCKGKGRGYVERQEVTGKEGKPLTFEMNFISIPGPDKKQITEG